MIKMKSLDRPYIICHMVVSIDGKVTGEFLSRPEHGNVSNVYYQINRDYQKNGASGFICGRITMESSFTGGWYPNLDGYKPLEKIDFIPNTLTGFYAVAFDPKGKLGWKSAFIDDYDPGYDKAQIIEVLTESVDGRYLSYLKEKNIPYIFAGQEKIDVKIALNRLKDIGINTILLEGGSIINGYFLDADCVDEISLVQDCVIADKNDKALFNDSKVSNFKLEKYEVIDGVMTILYKKSDK